MSFIATDRPTDQVQDPGQDSVQDHILHCCHIYAGLFNRKEILILRGVHRTLVGVAASPET